MLSASKEASMYLDNASTTWPKPPGVAQAVHDFISGLCPNPGRGNCGPGHTSWKTILQCRMAVAAFFGCDDPLRVCFTPGITWSLNTVILGMLKPGGHVVTGSMEHNAVMRPIRHLARKGVEFTVVKCDGSGRLDPEHFRRAIRPTTALAVLNHASNVNGAVQPASEIGSICRECSVPFLVDVAQSAGVIPVSTSLLNADIIAFTGHKALFGPMATGGLVFAPWFDAALVEPLAHGGTGSRSEVEYQPGFLPDRFEPGTPNGPGIAGLLAGVQFVSGKGAEAIRDRENGLAALLAAGLREIPEVSVFHADNGPVTAVVSFRVQGVENSLIAGFLSEEHGICCRQGLHCAPCAHRTLGTFPEGLVRLSPGCFNTESEILQAVGAVRSAVERFY